jgi:hypothetical protein
LRANPKRLVKDVLKILNLVHHPEMEELKDTEVKENNF